MYVLMQAQYLEGNTLPCNIWKIVAIRIVIETKQKP